MRASTIPPGRAQAKKDRHGFDLFRRETLEESADFMEGIAVLAPNRLAGQQRALLEVGQRGGRTTKTCSTRVAGR